MVYPGQLLGDNGHVCVLGKHEVTDESEKFMVMSFDLSGVPDVDLVVLQLPLHQKFCEFQRECQRRGIRVVVELDDDYFNLPEYNPAAKATAATDRRVEGNLLWLIWCVQHADAVTVTTPALRDSVREVNANVPVFVLRNFLHWDVWKHRDVQRDRGWRKFRVGYLGSGAWHGGDLETIRPWFGDWVRSHPDVEFVAASDCKLHDYFGIPDHQRVSTDLLAFRHQEIADIAATMDVGLVPLVRNRFNEAKSHLKGMEYAGVGVPCVASPTESYRDWWLAGRDNGERGAGFLVDGPDEWVYALDRLRTDRGLLSRMGRRARVLASENTIQKHWRLWEQAYMEILNIDKCDRSYKHKSGKRVDSLGVLS